MSGMHLLPVYYSTTNTRKRKQKKKSSSVLEAERKHAKFLKKMGIGGCSSIGRAPALQAGGRRFDSDHLHQSRKLESYNSDQLYNSSMAKKKPNIYTGTEIIGIAQMHKSNAVPVRGKKQAEEIARMRRG
jgi:hypothetical protein